MSDAHDVTYSFAVTRGWAESNTFEATSASHAHEITLPVTGSVWRLGWDGVLYTEADVREHYAGHYKDAGALRWRDMFGESNSNSGRVQVEATVAAAKHESSESKYSGRITFKFKLTTGKDQANLMQERKGSLWKAHVDQIKQWVQEASPDSLCWIVSCSIQLLRGPRTRDGHGFLLVVHCDPVQLVPGMIAKILQVSRNSVLSMLFGDEPELSGLKRFMTGVYRRVSTAIQTEWQMTQHRMQPLPSYLAGLVIKEYIVRQQRLPPPHAVIYQVQRLGDPPRPTICLFHRTTRDSSTEGRCLLEEAQAINSFINRLDDRRRASPIER